MIPPPESLRHQKTEPTSFTSQSRPTTLNLYMLISLRMGSLKLEQKLTVLIKVGRTWWSLVWTEEIKFQLIFTLDEVIILPLHQSLPLLVFRSVVFDVQDSSRVLTSQND